MSLPKPNPVKPALERLRSQSSFGSLDLPSVEVSRLFLIYLFFLFVSNLDLASSLIDAGTSGLWDWRQHFHDEAQTKGKLVSFCEI